MLPRFLHTFILLPFLTYSGFLLGTPSEAIAGDYNPLADYYTYQGNWFAYITDQGSAENVFKDENIQNSGAGIPTITPHGKIAIQLDRSAYTMALIDKATQSPIITCSISGGSPPLVVTPDGKKAAICNFFSNTVTIIDLATYATNTVAVGNSPSSIAIAPNGSFAYVTNSGSSSLTQIDLQTLGTLTIPGPDGSKPSFIAIKPDGKTALVSDNATDSVFIFNLSTLTFGKQIVGFSFHEQGLFPEIAITPDGTTAWVTNTSSNTISSLVGLDTEMPSFGSSIQVENTPNKIAITPDGKFAYVSNTDSNNVSIVTFPNASLITRSSEPNQGVTVQVFSQDEPSVDLDPAVMIPSSSPLEFSGKRYKNKFAAQTEYVNKLSWEASSDPAVVSYFLFRNGVILAIIPAGHPLKFIDHHRPKNQVDIYMLIAVNAFGMQSQPSIITIQ